MYPPYGGRTFTSTLPSPPVFEEIPEAANAINPHHPQILYFSNSNSRFSNYRIRIANYKCSSQLRMMVMDEAENAIVETNLEVVVEIVVKVEVVVDVKVT